MHGKDINMKTELNEILTKRNSKERKFLLRLPSRISSYEKLNNIINKNIVNPKEQKLINIVFDIGLTIHNNKWFKKKDNEQVAQWIREQLEKCGFEVVPVGCSHGVLKN